MVHIFSVLRRRVKGARNSNCETPAFVPVIILVLIGKGRFRPRIRPALRSGPAVRWRLGTVGVAALAAFRPPDRGPPRRRRAPRMGCVFHAAGWAPVRLHPVRTVTDARDRRDSAAAPRRSGGGFRLRHFGLSAGPGWRGGVGAPGGAGGGPLGAAGAESSSGGFLKPAMFALGTAHGRPSLPDGRIRQRHKRGARRLGQGDEIHCNHRHSPAGPPAHKEGPSQTVPILRFFPHCGTNYSAWTMNDFPARTERADRCRTIPERGAEIREIRTMSGCRLAAPDPEVLSNVSFTASIAGVVSHFTYTGAGGAGKNSLALRLLYLPSAPRAGRCRDVRVSQEKT